MVPLSAIVSKASGLEILIALQWTHANGHGNTLKHTSVLFAMTNKRSQQDRSQPSGCSRYGAGITNPTFEQH